MPVKRQYRKKKLYRKRRYGMRGKWQVARAPKVHTFKESFAYPTPLVAAAGAVGSGTLICNLNMLYNSTNFKGMFDLYRITGIKFKVVPRYNQADVLQNDAVPSGALPIIHIAPNRDPFVPPAVSLGDILNDDGVRTIRMDKPFSVYLKAPKPDVKLPDGATSVPMQFSARRMLQPWLTTGGNGQNIDQSGVNHYGFRWLIDNQAGVGVNAQVFATLYFQCKEQD